MSAIKHTSGFCIDQPIDIVFPLFSAEGEKLWVPGWTYENIMGSTELHEDYVFVDQRMRSLSINVCPRGSELCCHFPLNMRSLELVLQERLTNSTALPYIDSW